LEKICGLQQTPPVKTPQGCAGELMHRRQNETRFDDGRPTPTENRIFFGYAPHGTNNSVEMR
jgi:hypothetical protein